MGPKDIKGLVITQRPAPPWVAPNEWRENPQQQR